MSIFAPASPSARSIVDLAILAFVVTGLIFVIVEGVLLYSVWRFRQPPEEQAGEPAQVYGSMPIEIAWTAAPTLIVFFLVLVTTRTLWDVEKITSHSRPGDNALFVTVIGHQWWWEVHYDDPNPSNVMVTANEVHVPIGRTIKIDLRSLDRASLDWMTIGESIRKTHNVVVVEQGPLVCSYGALISDEIQSRFFDELDQPVKRIYGGLASPSVSAVLERAAIVGMEELQAGYLRMLADQGLPLPAGISVPPRVAALAG